jgi:hypothetical protein
MRKSLGEASHAQESVMLSIGRLLSPWGGLGLIMDDDCARLGVESGERWWPAAITTFLVSL